MIDQIEEQLSAELSAKVMKLVTPLIQAIAAHYARGEPEVIATLKIEQGGRRTYSVFSTAPPVHSGATFDPPVPPIVSIWGTPDDASAAGRGIQ